MISIEYDDQLNLPVGFKSLEQTAQTTLNLQSRFGVDVTLVFTNDTQVRTLNHKFRGVNAVTDVLAFPADEMNPETGRKDLGDVIVSVQRANKQAIARGHTLEAELLLLVVHGILHLLGYNHVEESDKVQMWAAQTEVLERIGISPIIADEKKNKRT